MTVALRIQTVWFVMAAFPSLVLVYDAHACVSFQGITPWIDFATIQLLFVASSMPLLLPGALRRRPALRYQQVIVAVDALVQLGAAAVHARGLTSAGRGLRTGCFQVDFGGVWYLVVVNVGGVALFVHEFLILQRLAHRGTGFETSAGVRQTLAARTFRR